MKKFLLLLAIFLFFGMIVYPQACFQAAAAAAAVWWQVVFPSLLPFFIIAELLSRLGVVHFLGRLLEPFTRAVFRLPGCAAFAIVMGFSSGFPAGANITAQLRREKLLSRQEGERLLAFTNNASPLFLFVASAVGLLEAPQLGIMLATVHYGSNLLIGILLRWLPGSRRQSGESGGAGLLLAQSVAAMRQAQRQNHSSLPEMTRDAIRRSVQAIVLVCGYMVLFSVLIILLQKTGAEAVMLTVLRPIFSVFSLDPELCSALFSGLFEMTLGVQAAGSSALPLTQKAIAAAAIIAWGGFSIQAQVSGMIAGTDLRPGIYLACRFLQAALSALGMWFSLHFLPLPAVALTQTSAAPHFLATLAPMLAALTLLLLLFLLGMLAWLTGRLLRQIP